MYSLGTLFVSGIYVQIPCIKEMMMMMMMMIMIIIIIIMDIKLPLNTEYLYILTHARSKFGQQIDWLKNTGLISLH
jgi:hypothetical protein